jgi:hypothetical protein
MECGYSVDAYLIREALSQYRNFLIRLKGIAEKRGMDTGLPTREVFDRLGIKWRSKEKRRDTDYLIALHKKLDEIERMAK